MPKVIWKYTDGTQVEADVADGENLMEAALDNDISGIIGACGGNLSCATCHVYVDKDWVDKLDEMEEYEDDMLDATDSERKPNSRLSCQIKACDELDGIVIHVPE